MDWALRKRLTQLMVMKKIMRIHEKWWNADENEDIMGM